MAKINEWTNTKIEDYPYPQVRIAAKVLLMTIRKLDYFAKPKQFNLSYCSLLEFEQVPSDGSRHRIRIEYPTDKMIDEVFRWQVVGSIGGRAVNVISKFIFHTHKNNRSGSGEWFINQKDAYLREDSGGLSMDDIWQDNNKWRESYGRD